MNTTAKGILILYDGDTEYAHLMTEYLKTREHLPWEIFTYTKEEELFAAESDRQADMLVAAENVYDEKLCRLQPGCMVLLNESGVMKWPHIQNVYKYRKAENILQDLLEAYMSVAKEQLPLLERECSTEFIGIYSPVRRCLQTSFALTFAQMLAENCRTLYLNFEHYSGLEGLLPDEQLRDMADLLYFLNTDGERFRLRMQTIVQRKGRLDYVPPMKAGQNLLGVTPEDWRLLLHKIRELGDYEYIILDLSECVQGLFEILRICKRIFTLTKEDRISKSKLLQYEQLLTLCEYGDVLEKTRKYSLPRIRRLPDEIEQYTKGELADYIRKNIEELREYGSRKEEYEG